MNFIGKQLEDTKYFLNYKHSKNCEQNVRSLKF
ncbi:ABC transporter ATP-binding protein [Leptospira interrogans]|uniref:ABC transporter ATP-binding protein n=4 Tax=Leptospira interrogans TaxID=173 RepID=A0AAP9WDW5_LEPIR|nr:MULTISPECIES: hypothetical protein [Leptospira]MBF3355213.1 ABC transporter ATP-binding protein [Leptospira borgpetersenii serovar Hardjo-bovis]AKH76475.1 ABC transporter ATP-binding protein [Leptospira interrogans serovar Bratislava]AKP25306.1 ABC transporter ATP-binding protein [Leptospira interrogans serovar Manilae]AKP29090.1 ABC transporter ATP-binding protein [Leptospira interrogans serovar Manilae]ARB96974.1 ABC transporter ATP-binding protein [Leptospira interrogans serovar Copenhag